MRYEWDIPNLVNVYKKKRWKDPPCFMGKLTISMAIFHSYVKFLEATFMKFCDFEVEKQKKAEWE